MNVMAMCCLTVICQLESSGKWPDEVEAIRQVKVAFYVHIAKALKKEKGLVASPTKDFLDIYKVVQYVDTFLLFFPSIFSFCSFFLF